jgi:hypothetical protein
VLEQEVELVLSGLVGQLVQALLGGGGGLEKKKYISFKGLGKCPLKINNIIPLTYVRELCLTSYFKIQKPTLYPKRWRIGIIFRTRKLLSFYSMKSTHWPLLAICPIFHPMSPE